MRIIIQRVSEASVKLANQQVGKIGKGLLVLLGIEKEDTQEDINWLTRKLAHLRIFADQKGNMNLSCLDVKGEVLVVSQFTLHAATKKGNRPNFMKAAKPVQAKEMYFQFISELIKNYGLKVETGAFGEMMKVNLINDGPVTIFMDSKNKE